MVLCSPFLLQGWLLSLVLPVLLGVLLDWQEPVDASLLPRLVGLLRSPDSGVCRAAVRAPQWGEPQGLDALCMGHDTHGIASPVPAACPSTVQQCLPVPASVPLFPLGAPCLQLALITTLVDLSADTKEAVLQAGALEPTVELLRCSPGHPVDGYLGYTQWCSMCTGTPSECRVLELESLSALRCTTQPPSEGRPLAAAT